MNSTLTWARATDPRFDFVEGELPLTSFTEAFITVLIYVIAVFALQEVWKKRKAVTVREGHPWGSFLAWFSYYHNLFLCFLSVAMLVGIVFEGTLIAREHGMITLVCDQTGLMNRGRMMWWYYIFYLSKFYELLDTIIMVLKKRPIIFLHWYHHFITLLLVWSCLRFDVNVMSGPICANAAVHVFMYYYYARSTRGSDADRKWCDNLKQWITRVQIWQFFFDEILVALAYYYGFKSNWQCPGGFWPTTFALFVITSFLVLFLSFYARVYGRRFGASIFGKKGKRDAAGGAAEAATSSPATRSKKRELKGE